MTVPTDQEQRRSGAKNKMAKTRVKGSPSASGVVGFEHVAIAGQEQSKSPACFQKSHDNREQYQKSSV